MKKIGVYGGTFDPVHLGHAAAAKAAVRALGLDQLLLIPAGDPPHKQKDPAGASGADRMEMLRIAADRLGPGIPAEVCDVEVARAGKSYTSDTLRTLRRNDPKAELWLLMGTDMFLTLHQWHEPDVICSLAHICAFQREEEDRSREMEAQREMLTREYGARVRLIPVSGLVATSSTVIRAALAAGVRPAALDDSVYGYILRRGLYCTRADLHHLSFPQLRACSRSMLRAKRIPHVDGVEQTAVRLAHRLGADVDTVRAAAILHDCTKYASVERHLALAEKYGITLDAREQRTEKLLHAKTGAAVASRVYGMPPAVTEAIRWHTTGKPNMTLPEKILYIADYMEPTRDFPGVERLRSLAEEDLDAALTLGLEMSIEEVREKGGLVHPDTLNALDYLRKEQSHG